MLNNATGPIVSVLKPSVPELYEPRSSAALIANCAERFDVSRASVLRYLRRFWERGQTLNALLPDYANSGAAGKTRGLRQELNVDGRASCASIPA